MKSLNQKDPRNLDILNYLAVFNEYNSKYLIAIDYRKQIAKLDPWNTENLLQLGRNYKVTGNIAGVNSVLDSIKKFDSISPESKTAQTELTS